MNVKEYISSGIIELYAMNALSPLQMKEVEQMATAHSEVAEEIFQVQESLNTYAASHARDPRPLLRTEIMEAIANTIDKHREIQFPPLISENSGVEEWLTYLNDNTIAPPEDYDMLHLQYLPGNEKQITYVAWAKKGAVVEESHNDENEFLLMLKGRCSVTINGKPGYYREGDIVFIPKGAVHRAEVLSDEPMLLIGQRIPN